MHHKHILYVMSVVFCDEILTMWHEREVYIICQKWLYWANIAQLMNCLDKIVHNVYFVGCHPVHILIKPYFVRSFVHFGESVGSK